MVNKPLIRPAISYRGGSFGGGPARIPLKIYRERTEDEGIICARVKSCYIGDKLIPPLIGILIMGPYKPLLLG